MLYKYIFFVLFQFLVLANAFSQSIEYQYLKIDDFFNIVTNHHPIAIQAQIELDYGAAVELSARGSLDPKIQTEIAQKNFKNQEYYNVSNTMLKVPTWFGIDFYTGFEQNRGAKLNPEHFTPTSGLFYAGFSLPIGQGLLIDKRRLAIQKAKLFKDITVEERRLILNELMYEAGKTYWDWFNAYHIEKVNEEGLKLAQERFNGIKRSAELGDTPFIDTLEASIQIQNRQIMLQQAQLNTLNARALLSVFLWEDGKIPLELIETTIPVEYNFDEKTIIPNLKLFLLDSMINNHPEVKQYKIKQAQYSIERKFMIDQLKPTINLKYNFLTEPINNNPITGMSPNNYNAGLEFSMPLFLRKERGNLKIANLQIQDIDLELKLKMANIKFKSQAALNEFNISREQYNTYSKIVIDSKNLLNGEKMKFEAGESSIFLVNTRETAYINAKVNQVQSLTKIRKSNLEFQFSLATLFVQ